MGILYRDPLSLVTEVRSRVNRNLTPGLFFLIFVYTFGSKPDLVQKFVVFISIITQNTLNEI